MLDTAAGDRAVVSHCGFNFHFPNDGLAMLTIFCVFVICMYSLVKCSNPRTFFELVVLLLSSIEFDLQWGMLTVFLLLTGLIYFLMTNSRCSEENG